MRARSFQRGDDHHGNGWFLAGYGGVAGFFAVEAVARERGRASNLTADANDRDSTLLIVVACVMAATLSPLLRRLPGKLPRGAAPAGLAMQAAGLGLRT